MAFLWKVGDDAPTWSSMRYGAPCDCGLALRPESWRGLASALSSAAPAALSRSAPLTPRATERVACAAITCAAIGVVAEMAAAPGAESSSSRQRGCGGLGRERRAHGARFRSQVISSTPVAAQCLQ
jgi:hypothetical protein